MRKYRVYIPKSDLKFIISIKFNRKETHVSEQLKTCIKVLKIDSYSPKFLMMKPMKNVFTALILFFAMDAGAQELNKKIEDPTRHKPVMLNLLTREGLVSFPEFKESYDALYPAYAADSTAFKPLGKALKDKKIIVVLGTWCGDSKMQVPHFLKVLDGAKIDKDQVTLIGVDGVKKAENGLIDSLKITNVPTFIITDQKGVEIGRITESPKETLEKDLLAIVSPIKK